MGTNSSSRSHWKSMNAFTKTFMACERRSERRSNERRSLTLWTFQYFIVPLFSIGAKNQWQYIAIGFF